jgi:hypothetical protein
MRSRSSGCGAGCGALVVIIPVFFWRVLPPAASAAATYFVDANSPYARDTNPGTEALPFQTIGKATSLVNTGDTVFVKAGVYRETVILSRSGTSTTATGRTGAVTVTSPITLAAYPGHEGQAIINAAEPLTNWRPCTGPQQYAGNPHWEHIYWADVAALVQSHPDSNFAVRQVFQHGKLLPRSRYPDTGWSYPTSMPDPMRSFTDETLYQPNGYFTGAVCHVKTAVWQIDQIPIASFSNATIIEDNTVEDAYTFGICVQATEGACDRHQILGNTVTYSAFRGISVDRNSAHTNVEGNYVYATGTASFGGDLMNGQTHGINVTGPYTRVCRNRIDRTAYTSIYVAGPTATTSIIPTTRAASS